MKDSENNAKEDENKTEEAPPVEETKETEEAPEVFEDAKQEDVAQEENAQDETAQEVAPKEDTDVAADAAPKDAMKVDESANKAEPTEEANTEEAAAGNDEEGKRKREEDEAAPTEESEAKKLKADDNDEAAAAAAPPTEETKEEGTKEETKPEPAPVGPSKEGTTIFNDHDVLSGRGGGTNVHPGNRNFRDLINHHRRAYLKARKNDKPAISRAIVRAVRENNGRFLKKDEKSGLWYEIGDDAAREKTSQALRQRAPEMRKLLFDTEREEARALAEEQMRQHQRMMMGMPPEMMAQMQNMPHPMMGPGGVPMFNPAMMAQMGKHGAMPPNGQDPYTQMFSMMGPMGRFPGPPGPNGAPAPPNGNGAPAAAAAAPAAEEAPAAAAAQPADDAAAAASEEATEPVNAEASQEPEAKPEPTAQVTATV